MKKLYSNQKESWAAEYCCIQENARTGNDTLACASLKKRQHGEASLAKKVYLILLLIVGVSIGATSYVKAQTISVTGVSPTSLCAGSTITVEFTAKNGRANDASSGQWFLVDAVFHIDISEPGGAGTFKLVDGFAVRRTNATFQTGRDKVNTYSGTVTIPTTLISGSYRVQVRSVPPEGVISPAVKSLPSNLFTVIAGAPVSGGDKSFTYGQTPSLTATAYEGQSIEWYDVDGNLVSTTSNTTQTFNSTTKIVTSSFTPSVATATTYVFYAQASGSCATTARTQITLTITRKPLAVTGLVALDKTYNGDTDAELDNSQVALEGIVGSDDVALNPESEIIAAFADRHAGPVKTVLVSGYTLTGTAANNYSLTQPSLTATITPLGITGGFTAKDKPFDGDVTAEVLTRFLVDAYSIDEVSLSGGTAAFNTPTQGTGKIVTLTGATLAGANAGNYNLTSVATTLANITAPTPLPVTLVSFEGSRSGNVVKLAWATASEKDNDYFEVQQSEDGKSFKVMGEKVKGAGTTAVAQSYKAIIAANSSNTLYYRLKQVDFDGKFEYSKVIAVEADGKATTSASLQAYPNPTPGKVMVSTEGSGPATVTLFHSSGRAVSQQQVQVANGQPISMDLTGQAAGVYYLQVQTGTGKSTTRIVKQ